MAIAKRINLVWLYVKDLERSIAFYEQLDVQLQLHPHDPHWAEHVFPDGTRFALHETTQPITPGTINFDFQVDDIDQAVNALRQHGIECGDVDREPWGSACELRDPDGYRIALFQPPA